MVCRSVLHAQEMETNWQSSLKSPLDGMVMTETVYSVQEYVEDLKCITAEETDKKAIF